MSRTGLIAGYVRQNAVAFLALFVALGGTGAYAANTVFSTDIVDGEVKNVDLAAGSVGNSKILPSSVTSSKILDGSIAGGDVDEGTLGKVPSATNADKLGGVAAKPVVRLVAPAPADRDRCTESPPATATFCNYYYRDIDGESYRWDPWRNVGGNTQPASFYKDAYGIVHLEGLVRGSTEISSVYTDDQTIFILPTGYRPATARTFAIIGREVHDDRDAVGRVDVTTTGRVTMQERPSDDSNSTSGLEFLSLDGIAFRTG